MKQSKRTKPESWAQLIATYDYHSTLYADGGLSLNDGFIVRHFDENGVTVNASGTSMTIPYDNCPRIKRNGTEIALYRIIDDDDDTDIDVDGMSEHIPDLDEIKSILEELESGIDDDTDDDDVPETSDVGDDEHIASINMDKFIETTRGLDNIAINPKHAIPLIKMKTVYEFDPDKLVVGDAYRLIWHGMILVFDKMFMRGDEIDILVTSVEPDRIEAAYVDDEYKLQRFVLEPNMKFSLKTLWYDDESTDDEDADDADDEE